MDGGERVVDLGDVNGRVFVNNVSLGVYAAAVQSPGYRAAKVRVLVESADEHGSWSTIGVSTNIIEASWQALANSVEYALLKHRSG